MGALYDLQNVSDAYGQNWNDATKLALACDYIDSLKIRDKFVTFLEQAVDEESTDNTFWCAEDEDGAVCFTALGTPLCQRCREAYEAGQARPDAEIIMLDRDPPRRAGRHGRVQIRDARQPLVHAGILRERWLALRAQGRCVGLSFGSEIEGDNHETASFRCSSLHANGCLRR